MKPKKIRRAFWNAARKLEERMSEFEKAINDIELVIKELRSAEMETTAKEEEKRAEKQKKKKFDDDMKF